MFYFKNLPPALVFILSNFGTSAYQCSLSLRLHVTAELRANPEVSSFTSFPSHSYKTCRHVWITSCFSCDPEIASTRYLHLCADHYLFWQSPFPLTTFLKVNIFLPATGLTHGVPTRLGSWWEINRVHLSSQMLGGISCLWKGKLSEVACFQRKLVLLFDSGKTNCLSGLYSTPSSHFK